MQYLSKRYIHSSVNSYLKFWLSYRLWRTGDETSSKSCWRDVWNNTEIWARVIKSFVLLQETCKDVARTVRSRGKTTKYTEQACPISSCFLQIVQFKSSVQQHCVCVTWTQQRTKCFGRLSRVRWHKPVAAVNWRTNWASPIQCFQSICVLLQMCHKSVYGLKWKR